MKRANGRLGHAIRAARLSMRMTQAELARKCGLQTSQISALETVARVRLKSAKVAVRMAGALGMSAIELLEKGHPEFAVWQQVMKGERK